MSEPPLAREPRRDTTAADAGSLERMGRIEEQPVPAPPEPAPPETDQADTEELTDALAEAGITATAEDRAAVQALASLDEATQAAVQRWLKTKQPEPQGGGKAGGSHG